MNFDEQLKRAVDTLGERLRDDISRELRLLADDLAASARADREAAATEAAASAIQKAEEVARDQAVRTAAEAAEAMRAAVESARAEQAAVASIPSPTAAVSSHAEPDDLEVGERLVTAIRAIDRARSLSEVLGALLESASHEAERAGVLLVRDARVRGWRFAGFAPSFDGAAIDIALDEAGAGIIAHAVEHRRAASSDLDGPAPAFAGLAEHADSTEAIAIPIVLAGEVVAVLYVDQRDAEPGILTLEPATLEVLARHAASVLETLTALKAVRSMTGAGAVDDETAGRSVVDGDANLFREGGPVVNIRIVGRLLFVAVLLSACLVARAEQQPDSVAGAAPAAQALQSSPVSSVALVLRPTDHPRVPRDVSQLWMAPDAGRVRTAAQANLATAIGFEADGSHAKALTLLSHPATAQKGPLGSYVDYYKGLAQLHLGQTAEARSTFQALQSRELSGFLVEAAALREAECDDTLGDHSAALVVYERLAAMKTTAPEEVLTRLAKAAKAIGNDEKARAALERVYYEFPLSAQSAAAAEELETDPIVPGNPRVRRQLARAERLFAARQYTAARSEFERLRNAVQGDDQNLVRLRLAEVDYHLKKFKPARDGVRPYIDGGPRQSEALYFYALSLRELDDRSQYMTLIRRVISEFPTDKWAEEALNQLATSYIREDEDDLADRTFRELYERFPSGRYAERAAWKIGWRAYRTGDYRETATVFSRASADFPRSDYRPSWLYWAGRAYEALGERPQAQARFTVAALDYLNSYYGRLAIARVDGRMPERRLVVSARGAGASALPAATEAAASSLPPNAAVVRELLVAKMYDQAIEELRYAQAIWGDSSPVAATIAWTYREQGKVETGSQQFSLYRGAINLMKRAYPQYLAAGGEQLPRDILRIIFPIGYWDLIQKNAAEHGLDPYLVAALAAQESTFVANIRSPAKATGVLQLATATAKQYAKRLDMKWSSAILTDPEANIRIGTAYLADKIREFGDLHLVLASYNAGERPVYRWMNERPGLSREEFIDDIPYPETQGYVKKILGTAEDYRRLYSAAALSGDDEIPFTTNVTAAASDVETPLTTRKSTAPAKTSATVTKKKPSAGAKKSSVSAKKKPLASKPARKRPAA